MHIKYKRIIHERMHDAPFIGALIVGTSCSLNCEGCFHEYMKAEEALTLTDSDIIGIVKSNPLNVGIILAGLEWSEQPEELVALVNLAVRNKLEVIIYSGLDLKDFFDMVPELAGVQGIYFKFGKYDSTQLVDDYYMYGVKLASKNQVIIKSLYI